MAERRGGNWRRGLTMDLGSPGKEKTREEAVQGGHWRCVLFGGATASNGPPVREVGKITRARKEKKPGTSGRRLTPEGQAENESPSEGIRLWAVFKRGSAHDPLSENRVQEHNVIGILDLRGGRAYGPRP